MKINFYDELDFTFYSDDLKKDIGKVELRCVTVDELAEDFGNYHYPEKFKHEKGKFYLVAWYPMTCSTVHVIGEVDPGEKPEWWDRTFGSGSEDEN